jgi:hypothetical protein
MEQVNDLNTQINSRDLVISKFEEKNRSSEQSIDRIRMLEKENSEFKAAKLMEMYNSKPKGSV